MEEQEERTPSSPPGLPIRDDEPTPHINIKTIILVIVSLVLCSPLFLPPPSNLIYTHELTFVLLGCLPYLLRWPGQRRWRWGLRPRFSSRGRRQ